MSDDDTDSSGVMVSEDEDEDEEEEVGLALEEFEEYVMQGSTDGPIPSTDELDSVLDQLVRKWIAPSAIVGDVLRASRERFNLRIEGNDVVLDQSDKVLRGKEAITAAYYAQVGVCYNLYLMYCSAGSLDYTTHRLRDEAANARFARVVGSIGAMFQTLLHERATRVYQNDQMYSASREDRSSVGSMLAFSRIAWLDAEKLNPFQRTVFYALRKTHEYGLRVYNGNLYAERVIPRYTREIDANGEVLCSVCRGPRSAHPVTILGRRDHAFRPALRELEGTVRTCAWDPIAESSHPELGRLRDSSVKHFLRFVCSKSDAYTAWHDLTSSAGVINDVSNYISSCLDAECEMLELTSACWSFYNGVLDGRAHPPRFYRWEDLDRAQRANELPSSLATMKFLPCWYDVDEIQAQLRGQPIADAGRPAKAKFSNLEEYCECKFCGATERLHNAAKCREARAELQDDGLLDEEDADGDKFTPILVCRHCKLTEDVHNDAECPNGGFFPYDFKKDAWFDIQTPCFDQILRYQRFATDPEEEAGVRKWIYAMLGRVFYTVGQYDDWQVIVMFKGQAACGKSTIGNVWKWLFPADDVGVLANNCQRTFALSSLLRSETTPKKIVICFETKGDFALDQAELQSMASGEPVCANIKQKTAVTIPRWTAHMLFMGNELPGLSSRFGSYEDKSGSLSRRMLIFDMMYEVDDAHKDGKLEDRIRYEESAALITKCIYAYREYAALYGRGMIWKPGVLPKYFHLSKQRMREETNGLEGFLNHPSSADVTLVKGEGFYIKQSEFIAAFKAFCRERSYDDNSRWTEDLWNAPFRRHGLSVAKRSSREYPPGSGVNETSTYIVGIGNAEYFNMDDDEIVLEGDEEQEDDEGAAEEWASVIRFIEKNVGSTPIDPSNFDALIKAAIFDRRGALSSLSDTVVARFAKEHQKREDRRAIVYGEEEEEEDQQMAVGAR